MGFFSEIAGGIMDDLGRSVSSGVASLVGGEKLEGLISRLGEILNASVGRGGQIVEIAFSRDSTASGRTLRVLPRPALAPAGSRRKDRFERGRDPGLVGFAKRKDVCIYSGEGPRSFVNIR